MNFEGPDRGRGLFSVLHQAQTEFNPESDIPGSGVPIIMVVYAALVDSCSSQDLLHKHRSIYNDFVDIPTTVTVRSLPECVI
jgi:hypothetical protein